MLSSGFGRTAFTAPSASAFSGLWGVFADSLPDAWGRLLVDRMLQSQGFSPAHISQLERLAIVGKSGMGALTYHPAWDVSREASLSDLDELAAQCQAVLNHQDVSNLDDLYLAHFWITLLFRVLGRDRRVDDCRINNPLSVRIMRCDILHSLLSWDDLFHDLKEFL